MRLGQEAPVGADLAAPIPVHGETQSPHNNSASVVFNTNEQKTATIGRVPRVSKTLIISDRRSIFFLVAIATVGLHITPRNGLYTSRNSIICVTLFDDGISPS